MLNFSFIYVLSEDKLLTPVIECLQYASDSNQGAYQYTLGMKFLTQCEVRGLLETYAKVQQRASKRVARAWVEVSGDEWLATGLGLEEEEGDEEEEEEEDAEFMQRMDSFMKWDVRARRD